MNVKCCEYSSTFILIGSSLFLQVTRTTIKSQMSLKFGQIRPWTAQLAALDQLNKCFTYLRAIQNILMTCWLSGERSLPYGLLVVVMPPTLKKWRTYWFRLVRMYVCVCVCLYVCMYSCSRYRLETSCMDSSWKNSRRIFLVFPELSPLVKSRPFDKQGYEIL